MPYSYIYIFTYISIYTSTYAYRYIHLYIYVSYLLVPWCLIFRDLCRWCVDVPHESLVGVYVYFTCTNTHPERERERESESEMDEWDTSEKTWKGASARFTSRPEARGSGVEDVFRFLGSGVDSRGKKGRKGSEGREIGSGVRLQCKTSPM